MTSWQLQEAKNRFSAVVEAALTGEPQEVTRRGKPVVVVLAFEEYQRLREAKAEGHTLICGPSADHPEGHRRGRL